MRLVMNRNTAAFLAVILAAVSIVGIAHGQSSVTNTASCGNPNANMVVAAYCDALPIMVIAVLMAFAISALIFLLGAALKNDRLRNYGIGEFYEAFSTAIIVALFLYIAWVIISVIPSFIGGTPDPVSFTLTSINQVEASAMTIYADNIYGPYYSATALIGNQFTCQIGGLSSIMKGLCSGASALGTYTSPILFFTYVLPLLALGQLLLDGIYVLWVEYFLIQFFFLAAVPAFIAPGVVFRAIIPTRAFGGTLIAMGIGFYIVLPTLFAFAFSTLCPGFTQGSSVLTCQTGGTLPPAVQSLPIEGSNGQNLIGQYLAPFWLMILFYPALIIALTYAFITQLSNFIGQATSTGGRLRVLI